MAGVSPIHFWVTAALAIGLFPAARLAGLDLSPPGDLLQIFVIFGLQAMILSGAAHLLASPRMKIDGLRQAAPRIVMLAVLVVTFVAILGWSTGLYLGAAAAVAVEFLHRTPRHRIRTVASFLVPVLYLFSGICLLWYYNEVVVTFRFFGAYDPLFLRMDSWLGIDVPAISKAAARSLPLGVFTWSETIYFAMFGIVGAGVMRVATRFGFWRAMQLVGLSLLAYYIALALFVAFPSQGPYYVCVDHATTFPRELGSYGIHARLVSHLEHVWRHGPTGPVSGGYFIAFPCMHIVKPALVMWFLRDEKRIVVALAVYEVLLLGAIVLLEYHYIVDIVAGVGIIAAMIAIDRRAWRPGGAGQTPTII